jgi:hypothetical protein
MQDNQITITDVDINGTPTDLIYTRVREKENQSVYQGPDGSLSNRQEMALTRKYPIRQGNSQGVMEVRIRFAEDVSVAGVETSTTVEHLNSCEIILRVAVGTTDAEIVTLLSKMAIQATSTSGLLLAQSGII